MADVAERWTAAANRKLIEVYKGYSTAYSGNLNHHWSGLAAVQMCAIAKSLAGEETWEGAFDDERTARDMKDELSLAFDELKGRSHLHGGQADQ